MNIKTINKLLYLGIAVMAIINLFCTNSLATQGVEINDLYQKSQSLEKSNQELEAKINNLNRLSYIQELAEAKGYRRINEVDLVSTTSLVANNLGTIYP